MIQIPRAFLNSARAKAAFLTLVLASCSAAFAGLFGGDAKEVTIKVGELALQNGHALVRGVDFSPDGNHLAVDAEGPSVEIWDWRNRRLEKSLKKPGSGNDFSAGNPVRYSPDGRLLANCGTTGADKVVARVWAAATGLIEHDIIGGPETSESGVCTAIDFSTDSNLLFLLSSSHKALASNVFAYETHEFAQSWRVSINPFFDASSLAVSPAGELVAASGSHSEWNAGVVTNELSINIISIDQRKIVKGFRVEAVGPVAWNKDGQQIGVAGGTGVVEILDAQSGEVLVSDKNERAGDMNIRFTSDGRYFIQSDLNGSARGLGIQIWDAARKTLLQEIPGDVGSIAVSRDGRYLAVGVKGRVTIWRLN
jgi:WD40 repeat protein